MYESPPLLTLFGIFTSRSAFPHVDASFAKLNDVLVRNVAGDSTFLLGSAATSPDFHLWEMCDQVLPPLLLLLLMLMLMLLLLATHALSSTFLLHFTKWTILSPNTRLSAPSTSSPPRARHSLLLPAGLFCS